MYPASTVPLLRSLAIQTLLLKERWRTGVDCYLSGPGFLDDPYPTYRALRERDPVHWSELAQAWVVTRYDHVATVLRDPRFGIRRTRAAGGHLGYGTGVHACLGGSLARMEAGVIVQTLARRFPNLHLDPGTPPVRRPAVFMRGLQSLPLELEPGP